MEFLGTRTHTHHINESGVLGTLTGKAGGLMTEKTHTAEQASLDTVELLLGNDDREYIY